MALYPDDEPINILSLCSGISGIELGLRLAIPRARVVCHVEREAFAAAVIVARMEDKTLDQAPVWDNIGTFDGKSWRGVVDIISAGFPCQPFSVAGKRKGTKDERWIWGDIARILREVRPRYIFLENVPGLLSGGAEHVFRDLAKSGFDAEWGVFSAQQCGAPHIRKRLFILAHRNGERRQQVSRGSHADETEHEGWRAEKSDKPECGCEDVAVSQDIGYERTRTTRRRRGGSQDYGEHMANPDNSIGWENKQKWKKKKRAPTRRASEELGNSSCQGCMSECQSSSNQPTFNRCGWSKHYYFPPGPNDTDEWSEVIKRDPSVIPSLCRVADGISPELVGSIMQYRADRLRALGNAVVPIVAAYAFRVLMKRLEEE